MKPRWRIIDTGALDPSTNMALDEALLRGYLFHSSPPTLRLYGWKHPGLSIGFSQDPKRELDIELCSKRSMPFVRRITGGGIILHGDELTYSLVCSKEDLGIPVQVVSSYKIISSFLISFYNSLGIKAEFACDTQTRAASGTPSALCFAAKEKYDIVSNGRKIGGSAQRRIGNVIFQHGSVPITFEKGMASLFLRVKPPDADESRATCLKDILGRDAKIPELSRLLTEAFVKSFDVEIEARGLSEPEKISLARMKTFKYESADWNFNRVEPLEFGESKSERTHKTALVDQ